MAKVYDVPAGILINRLAEILRNEDIPAPEWAQFVKTGTHAVKPPQNSDWWHVRCSQEVKGKKCYPRILILWLQQGSI